MAHLAAPAADDVGPGAVLTGLGTFALPVRAVNPEPAQSTGYVEIATGIPRFGVPPAVVTTGSGFIT